MARLEARRWAGDAGGQTRRDRRPCDYAVYIPDPLVGRRFVLDGDVAADVADAEAALIRLDATAGALADASALARLLLRAEAVASSRIEGLEVGGRRLLRAQAARQLGEEPRDVTAVEVLGNIEAMARAVEAVPPGGATQCGDRARGASAPARRDAPRGARRSHQDSPELDRRQRLQPVCSGLRATAARAGRRAAVRPRRILQRRLPARGRAGRHRPRTVRDDSPVRSTGTGGPGAPLIHLVLRRRGLAPRILPPVSLILATWPRDYVAGLTGTRYEGAPDSEAAFAGINRWIALFASVCRRSAEDAGRFEEQVRALQDSWRERLGAVRRGSAADLLVRALPGAPLLTTTTASDLIGRSFQATSRAIDRLVEAGVLKQVTVGRRNRAFEAPELIEAFTALERQLASPEGDTLVSAPIRRVPRRRP